VLRRVLWHAAGVRMPSPLSDGFVDLMQMIVAPVIFCAGHWGSARLEHSVSGRSRGESPAHFLVVLTAVLHGRSDCRADLLQPGARDATVSVSDLGIGALSGRDHYDTQ